MFKPLEFINFWPIFLRACAITEELSENKAMYKEGEDRYLKDLDCVNIVKSIRELKALTRVILDQQQRHILSFERESVLPSNKYWEELDANLIQNIYIKIFYCVKNTVSFNLIEILLVKNSQKIWIKILSVKNKHIIYSSS